MLTQAQLDKLRHEFANIKKIDPEMETYKKLTANLDNMPKKVLQQLASANIKWVSMLARNRIR